MKAIKLLVLVLSLLLFTGCSSIEITSNDYTHQKPQTVSHLNNAQLPSDENLKELKTNIDTAHRVGANHNSPEADKYIDSAMEALERYLLNNNEDSIDVESFKSFHIKVSQNSEYILAEYDKDYLTYNAGVSGDYTSWKVIKFKPYNLVDIFVKNVPLQLSFDHRMVKVNGNPMLFIYGYGNYDKAQVVFIRAYKIEKTGVTEIQPIKNESAKQDLWIYRKDGFISTNKYMNKIFDLISEDGKEVTISASESGGYEDRHFLNLKLNENGQYEISSFD